MGQMTVPTSIGAPPAAPLTSPRLIPLASASFIMFARSAASRYEPAPKTCGTSAPKKGGGARAVALRHMCAAAQPLQSEV